MGRRTELRPGPRFPTELRLTELRESRDWVELIATAAVALALGVFFGAMLALWWVG